MSARNEAAFTEAFNRELFDRRFDSFEPSERECARVAWTRQHVPVGVSTVLDVGSGHAGLANRLAAEGYRVTGLDVSVVSLKRVRAHRVQGSALSLPFMAEAFDLVVCAEVIEHLSGDERRRCLDELWRVARRHVLITVPDNEDLDANLVRCDRCGYVFNAWGHVARFDGRSVRTLFDLPPAAAVVTLGFPEPSYWPPLRYIRRRLLCTYGHEEHLVCPHCLNDRFVPPQRSLAVKVLDRINYYIAPQRQVGWLMAIWEKPAVQDRALSESGASHAQDRPTRKGEALPR